MFALTVRSEEKRVFQWVLAAFFVLGVVNLGLAYRGQSVADAVAALIAFFGLGPMLTYWWFRV
jgi:hypothetical protein